MAAEIPEDLKECYDACIAARNAGCEAEEWVDVRTEITLIERLAQSESALSAAREEIERLKQPVTDDAHAWQIVTPDNLPKPNDEVFTRLGEILLAKHIAYGIWENCADGTILLKRASRLSPSTGKESA